MQKAWQKQTNHTQNQNRRSVVGSNFVKITFLNFLKVNPTNNPSQKIQCHENNIMQNLVYCLIFLITGSLPLCNSLLSMRFGQQLHIIAIPEWKDCYLNYEILKIFVMIIKQTVEAVGDCDDIMKELSESQNSNLSVENMRLSEVFNLDLSNIRSGLMEKLSQQNELFYKIYITQAQITQLFYQMKVIQIEERFDICSRLQSRRVKKDLAPIFLTYIEYAYIEISYISEMREANLEAERKILKKHKKYAKKKVETPQPSHDKINRMACIQTEYINKIEDLYVSVQKDLPSKEAREFLREAAHKQDVKYSDYFLFGIGVGATTILLGTLIFIIVYQNLSIENSTAFSRDFPTWRGVAFFILYIWLLGFDVYCFEKYKISHRLIFKFNDHHYSTSSSVFKIAGFYTAIFMVVFLIYLLFLTKIINNNAHFRSQYLVLIVWGLLGAYVFMPLPIFNYQGRLYALKLNLRCLLSPIFGVEFIIVWMTDQWISMVSPLRDLAYTVCYFTRLDFNIIKVNPCKDNSTFEVILLVVIIAISFRIMQCIRLGLQEGKYLMTPHMANTCKYLASLITAAISYVYNLGYTDLLWLWIVTSVISTMFSYMWDLKFDWGLLEPNCKNWLLRKYLTFQPKRNYYLVILANFIMRCSWTLTLSPSIAAYFGNSSLLTFVTGSIEIIRRGIWNLLRVEKEHLRNCNEFKAIPDMKNLQDQLYFEDGTQVQLIIEGQDKSGEQVREMIKKSYINLIKKKIQDRDAEQKQYNSEYQAAKIAQIKQIKRKIKQISKAIRKQS